VNLNYKKMYNQIIKRTENAGDLNFKRFGGVRKVSSPPLISTVMCGNE